MRVGASPHGRDRVAEDVNQMPVLADGRLVGLVTREDMLRRLQARAELGI